MGADTGDLRMLRTLGLMVLAICLVGTASWAAAASAAATWTLDPAKQPGVCTMSGPSAGGAQLGLGTEGPLLWLFLTAAPLPMEQATVTLAIQVDAGPIHQMPVLATSHTAGLSLGGAAAHDVANASRITIGYQGQTWVFPVAGTAAALDVVARCAGEPTLAERDAAAPKPIVGAGDWKLMDRLPGAAGYCSARINGQNVDTILMPTNDNVFVLVAGRPDWAAWGGDAEIGLSIDGAPPEQLKANSLQNLVLLKIDDSGRARRLRAANTLDWTLPSGHFHAEVKGLGAALDAIAACQARQSPAKG